MELSWMGFNMKEPTIHKDYWCTVYNKYWNEPKAMMLYWGEEDYKGLKRGVWMLNGSKIPSTFEVRWWMELQKAKEDD
jgi:hypothetical protein